MNRKEPKIIYDDSILDFFIDEILAPYLEEEEERCLDSQANSTNEKN